MPGKDAFQESVNVRLGDLYDAIEHHERHLASTESVSHEAHEDAIRALKAQRDHVNKLMKELEAAGEHGWEHLRHGIETAIGELKTGVDRLRAMLRG